MDQLEARLLQTLNIDEIPSLPDAAKVAISATLSAKKSAEAMSKVIAESPSLTLKILKVANSSIYSRIQKVSSIKEAIVLLGFKTVKSIILSVAMKDVFPEERPGWFDYRGFWIHSIATALISEEIAKLLLPHSNSAAYAAGLLHDIGKAVFLLSNERRYNDVVRLIKSKKLTFRQAEIEVFGFDHTDVADFLLEYWELPQSLILPIREHHTMDRHALEKADMDTLIVKISNEVSHIIGFTTFPSEPPYTVTNRIIERLGLLQIDLDRILEKAKKGLESITEVLDVEKSDIKGYFEALASANRELGNMYLENQKIIKDIEGKKDLLASLNELCIVFLKERNIENIVRRCLKTLLETYRFRSASIEYYLNDTQALFFKLFYPNLFKEKNKTGEVSESEEMIKIVRQGEVRPLKKELVYTIESGNGLVLGRMFIEHDGPLSTSVVQPFLDHLALGLNTVRLNLLNEMKTKRLKIAIRRLREENKNRIRLAKLNELMLDSSPASILSVDKNGTVTQFNKQAESIFMQDLANTNFFCLDLFTQKGIEASIESLVKKKETKDMTVSYNGKDRHLHITAAPIEGTTHTLIHITDLTERIENEKLVIQREKMATLGELAAGIAHNLRSPLAVVKGIPELIISDLEKNRLQILSKENRRENKNQEIKENMLLISRSMEKAFAIIDNLMEFSKMEPHSFEHVGLTTIINEAYLFLEYRFKEKRINLINSTSHCFFYGNKSMLIQVFVNLLSNSLDAVREEGIVEISCKKENARMIIHLADNGRGIPQADLERAFEPFFTTSQKANGRGVGLSITRKIITIHGGTIKALPRSGGGTIMEIILPIREEK